jgi:hypothetical protein
MDTDIDHLKRILKELDEIKIYIAYQQEKEARTYTRLLQSKPVVKPVSVDVTIDGKTYSCLGKVLYNDHDEICGTKREDEYILFKDN